MSEHKEPIPSMIYNASVGGHVTNSQQIIDENENKEQSQINSEVKQSLGQGGSVDLRIAAAKSEIIGNATSACDTLGKAEAKISNETSRAQAAEQLLREQYNALTQSDIIVGALPASGIQNKIYRVPGTTSYSDYMWNGSSFVKMAEYDNAIDDEPTTKSNNLVKSGGIDKRFYDSLFNNVGNCVYGESYDNYNNIVKNINAVRQKFYTKVSPNQVIKWVCGFPPSNALSSLVSLIEFDENFNKIDFYSSHVEIRTLTMKNNAAYIRASFNLNIKDIGLYDNATNATLYKPVVSSIKENISDIYNKISFYSEYNSIKNISLQPNAETTKLNNIVTSKDFISVTPNSKIIWVCGNALNYNMNNNAICLIFYGSDKKSVINFYTANAEDRIIPIPSEVYYIKASFITYQTGIGIYETDGTPIFIPIYEKIQQQVDNLFSTKDILDYWNRHDKLVLRNIVCNSNFNFIFVSDLHKDIVELQRINLLSNVWGKAINTFIIDAGDDVQSYMPESLSWINDIIASSKIPYIRAIGNHDAWIDNFWNWNTVENIYNNFTKPTIDALINKSVSVHQPTNAESSFFNYYYVDYDIFRIIVLFSLQFGNSDLFYDVAQDAWFKEVLSDSLANNKHVICVNHGPINSDNANELESNWSCYKKWKTEADNQHVNDLAVEAVDSFISSGGNFICWLTGHSHRDHLLETKNTINKQFCFVSNCASCYQRGDISNNVISNAISNENFYIRDLFNLIGIDVNNGFIRILRIGQDINNGLQKHSLLCYDYKNNLIISES